MKDDDKIVPASSFKAVISSFYKQNASAFDLHEGKQILSDVTWSLHSVLCDLLVKRSIWATFLLDFKRGIEIEV